MININDYDYQLPDELRVKEPVTPRDTSRLFIYNTQTNEIKFDQFYNLDQYLPPKSFLVLNKTKVIPSRITLYKDTGGKVICLLLVNEMKQGENIIRTFVDRKVNVGQRLFIDKNHSFNVVEREEKIFTLKFDFPKKELMDVLEKKGEMPIPPYLKNSPLNRQELKKKYQPIFAQNLGSSAAPTASLHFSKRVFKKLDQKGTDRQYVTLHVGLGTFAPIDENNLVKGKLHSEWIEVEKAAAEAINSLKEKGLKTVAVGTTVVRSLESVSEKSNNHYLVKPYFGETEIFIFPPYAFKAVDILITNFHMPKTSLMMLVDAFLRHKGAKRNIVDLYKIAIKNKFRFYSFGDAMLIL